MTLTPIFVDGRRYEVDSDMNALEACLSLKLNLPYFCWHAALGSVGACRQCAVKHFRDEHDTKGKLVMACLTPVARDMRISIHDPEARDFRAAIIQGLMQSHPHDCPVCDEGGECHLQDMTVMTGHDYRHYSFSKRTFRNQDLGPFVNHEMNRCIQCYRCVRFYRDYAGGQDFDNFGIRNVVYFGRRTDGVLENEFAGNLVEVCPTGVFTDKTLKEHYTRKWDLQMAPSICVHCGLGCNTSPGERYGTLRRIVNRYHEEVNGFFLCDRGRFGYEFVNSKDRIRMPQLRSDEKLQAVSKKEALERFRALFELGVKVIGIGSPRASLESNFALRELVGPQQFFSGLADREFGLIARAVEILRTNPAPSASLRRIENADAVLILGEDLTNTAPRMALSVRQSVRRQPYDQIAAKLNIPAWNDQAVRVAVQDAKGPLFVATPAATKLDDVATETYRGAPDDLARLGFAIAHALDSQSPGVPDLPQEARELAQRAANALKSAHAPVVISGVSCFNESLLEAAANVTRALHSSDKNAAISLVLAECNSLGLALLHPRPLEDAVLGVNSGEYDIVIILENDLYRRLPYRQVDQLLFEAGHIVVLDSIASQALEHAELVLPAATFAESTGTLISSEGRAQRFFQVFVPGDEIQPSWRWLRDAMVAAGRQEGRAWQNLDSVLETICERYPELAAIRQAAPPASFRLAGQKVPREPHRYSGRTSMFANVTVREPKPPDDADSALVFSMEGYAEQPPPSLIPFFWSPGWNSIGSTYFYQAEVGGPLRGGDPGVHVIQPAQENGSGYFRSPPRAFARPRGEWLFLPSYHIFGSEELSRHSRGIAQLSPEPYVGLNADDISELRTESGERAEVDLHDATYRLQIRAMHGLAPGTAALPVGLPSLEGVQLPAWGRILPVPGPR